MQYRTGCGAAENSCLIAGRFAWEERLSRSISRSGDKFCSVLHQTFDQRKLLFLTVKPFFGQRTSRLII